MGPADLCACHERNYESHRLPCCPIDFASRGLGWFAPRASPYRHSTARQLWRHSFRCREPWQSECTLRHSRLVKNISSKRRVPYHQLLTALMLFLFALTHSSQAQTIRRYEGILIDTSGSIRKGDPNSELFREYLLSTKKLLLTEPANSRVWVSTISTDSFGGVSEILKGWTPDARGVFTNDLNRARHQLASTFEANSSGVSPVNAGTDIFGGLWSLKVHFESAHNADRSNTIAKDIWIFSDMMNERKNFPMPELLAMGSELMLQQAKANGLLVPLRGYRVYIYGASMTGLTPQTWAAVKKFWTGYFSAAGAELVAYSAECDSAR